MEEGKVGAVERVGGEKGYLLIADAERGHSRCEAQQKGDCSMSDVIVVITVEN